MRRILPVSVLALLPASGIVALTPQKAWADDEKDPVQPKTVWKGEIRQEGEDFPATIYINGRDNERIKGEVHFQDWHGDECKLTFHGNVVDRQTVVWITDKKEGNGTFPGLYIGKVKGDTISGTWQVPSAKQYDRFSVKLAELDAGRAQTRGPGVGGSIYDPRRNTLVLQASPGASTATRWIIGSIVLASVVLAAIVILPRSRTK
jgi:hypothetical protein